MCNLCDGPVFFGLAEPQEAMLDSYAEALSRGWSPNNLRDVSAEQLAAIAKGREQFIDGLLDQSGTVQLADGSEVPRIPFFLRWMWDGAFCGVISLRYLPGTNDLPPHVAGHIGYAVVPWKRNHGYATRALGMVLEEAKEQGLSEVILTTEPGNAASRTVIERNWGEPAGTWSHASVLGGAPQDRYVIDLKKPKRERRLPLSSGPSVPA